MVKEQNNSIANCNICEYDLFAGKLLSLFIILYITNNVLALMKITSDISTIVSVVSGVFFWFFLLFNQNTIGKNWIKIFLGETVFLSVCLVSAFCYENLTVDFFKRIYWTIVYCVPFGCIWYDVKNLPGAFYTIDKGTCYGTIVGVLFYIASLMHLSTLSSVDYSMGLGYAFLIVLVYHMMMIKYHYSYVFLSMLDFTIILFKGSRAPILWAVIFVCLLAVMRYKLFSKASFKITMKFGFVFGLVMFYSKEIVSKVVSVMDEFGLYSRTLSYLVEKPFYTGRDSQWQGAILHIQEKITCGWGVGYNFVSSMGMQPHNLFLELLLQYGCIIGGIVIVLMIVCFGNAILRSAEQDREILLVFFSTGFLPLMLSSTYLTWPLFWILGGICIKKKFLLK